MVHLLALNDLVLLATHEHVLDASDGGTGRGEAGRRSKVCRDRGHFRHLGLRSMGGRECEDTCADPTPRSAPPGPCPLLSAHIAPPAPPPAPPPPPFPAPTPNTMNTAQASGCMFIRGRGNVGRGRARGARYGRSAHGKARRIRPRVTLEVVDTSRSHRAGAHQVSVDVRLPRHAGRSEGGDKRVSKGHRA